MIKDKIILGVLTGSLVGFISPEKPAQKFDSTIQGCLVGAFIGFAYQILQDSSNLVQIISKEAKLAC